MEIICSDDSAVNESFPDTNYGADDIISVEKESDNFTALYLAFDISDKPINYIKVELAVNLWYISAPDQDYDMQLVKLDNLWCDRWSETNITWNNKPEYYIFITSFKVDTTDQSKTYTFDITNHTDNHVSIGCISLVLEAIDEGKCNCLSKEYSPSNSSDAPRLILYYLENSPEIPFGDFNIMVLIVAFGITIKIIQMKNKNHI